ncbi:hypothetical protein GCM10009676_40280 [Prauserella halophila]|uniref:HTH cro/C1-type domain-containing protein n=1 Tax=Prauserella halophila TaxID=185641 RepID=A0ABP4H4W4_9PSEU|nr:helix-turn-helix domain-containing protein [Prauserella halophila]MCP2236809.1 Helix-turn-helix domain-containing protein [Prauserella halophila]
MAENLNDLDRLRPVDPTALAEATEALHQRERSWQFRELRTRTQLTQAEIAERMHVGQNRVLQIEPGGVEHARSETLRTYAEALGGELNVEIKAENHSYHVA